MVGVGIIFKLTRLSSERHGLFRVQRSTPCKSKRILTDNVTQHISCIQKNVAEYAWLAELPPKFSMDTMPEKHKQVFEQLDFEITHEVDGSIVVEKPFYWYVLQPNVDRLIKLWSAKP